MTNATPSRKGSRFFKFWSIRDKLCLACDHAALLPCAPEFRATKCAVVRAAARVPPTMSCLLSPSTMRVPAQQCPVCFHYLLGHLHLDLEEASHLGQQTCRKSCQVSEIMPGFRNRARCQASGRACMKWERASKHQRVFAVRCLCAFPSSLCTISLVSRPTASLPPPPPPPPL